MKQMDMPCLSLHIPAGPSPSLFFHFVVLHHSQPLTFANETVRSYLERVTFDDLYEPLFPCHGAYGRLVQVMAQNHNVNFLTRKHFIPLLRF